MLLFKILHGTKLQGLRSGSVLYISLMGASWNILGLGFLVVNANNACLEVHDAGERHHTIVTNEVQELFNASYKKYDMLEVLFSSNQMLKEIEPFNGTCVDHLNNDKNGILLPT